METYLVGGAVRDKLLGIAVRDRDWVVVGATEQAMLDQGYLRIGKDFPVFLHPQTQEEYALARMESKEGHGYKGFRVEFSPSVTLEEDLLRRDLTINAIAEASDGSLIDPYNGQQDIQQRVLRHVSSAFSEDPLRVLRVARFAARYAHLGFSIAAETLQLMADIVKQGELRHLVSERIWQEFESALKEASPSVFVSTLRECGALKVILPEVDVLFGVPQPEKYHPEVDTGLHIILCLEQATRLSEDPVVRYATLVHDVGKGVTPSENWPHHYQHEGLGVDLLSAITTRLNVPNEYSDIARLVCLHHTKMHRLADLRSSTILELLEALDAFRRPQRLQQFLLACEADARGRTGFEERDYPQSQQLIEAFEAANKLDFGALLANRSTENEKPGDVKEFVHQQRIKAIHSELGRKN
jgi:tRNA nucleotidyltransferase (CCA-adding enzyme)